ncbi:MAG: methyltransferase domain-containing protein [candidate division NC10 bacterium]|nr:methyltransferase domain-containing protein [candidate division NC10 bacterium]
MSTPISIAFARGAAAYKAYLESPHGRLRLELIWHQLSGFMGKAWGADRRPLQVLDIGCGTGELSLRLAARGHAVVLLDPVEEMLRLAEETARALESPPVIPPRFVHGSLEVAPALFGKSTFDLVLCHTLLEYLPDPRSVLALLRTLLTPGGFLSLVALNRGQEPLRLAIRDGKFEEARRALAGDVPMDSLFGLPRNGMLKDQLQAQLEAAGINSVAHAGIFVFADYLPAGRLEDPASFAPLLRLELEAGGLSPLREIARYLHLWGRRA